MKKLIIHTEREIPSEAYLKGWFNSMAVNTDIPRSVLNELRKSGSATWATISGEDVVTTTYRIE